MNNNEVKTELREETTFRFLEVGERFYILPDCETVWLKGGDGLATDGIGTGWLPGHTKVKRTNNPVKLN